MMWWQMMQLRQAKLTIIYSPQDCYWLVTVPEEVAAIEDAIVEDAAAVMDATSLVFLLLYGVCHLSNEALLYSYCVFVYSS
jgi:hypothetical protein